MANKTFFEAFGATINEAEVAKKGGLSYLAAATAMRLAGRPEVIFVDFGDKPYLEMLGGAVVAVDIKVPDTDATQRTWLPVMDRDNQTLALSSTHATDINNSRQRCLVKAIASVFGDGLSLYLGCDGDGPKAVKMLGVTPDTDLETATPVVATLKEGGAPYIEWGVGLAACRITDPTFYWEVVMWNGLPYREVLGGLMVDVDTVYDGIRQRLSLPIMDAAFNPLPAAKASVFDWNKTVMRALTKCIAFNSGYGLGVYADEFGNEKDAKGKSRKNSAPKAEQAKAEVKAEAEPAPVTAAASAETVAKQAEPVKADATPEKAAQAPAATATPASVPDSDAVLRFREVMRKRRVVGGVQGVISLYDALAKSTKFAEEDKPNCFAVLVTATASIVDAENITGLLLAIKKYSAMQYLALDTRDIVAAKLTSVLLEATCAAGDDALKTAPEDLVSAGVAQDVDDVIRLAAIGNVPMETVDLLRDVLERATA